MVHACIDTRWKFKSHLADFFRFPCLTAPQNPVRIPRRASPEPAGRPFVHNLDASFVTETSCIGSANSFCELASFEGHCRSHEADTEVTFFPRKGKVTDKPRN